MTVSVRVCTPNSNDAQLLSIFSPYVQGKTSRELVYGSVNHGWSYSNRCSRSAPGRTGRPGCLAFARWAGWSTSQPPL